MPEPMVSTTSPARSEPRGLSTRPADGVPPALVQQLQRVAGNHAVAGLVPVAVQREKFVGVPAKHHLHVEINQDHYKFGNDRGSRISIGVNGTYKLDKLIEVRNHLVANPGGAGHAECVTWLEQQARAHPSWDEETGFDAEAHKVPNPHVDSLVEQAGNVGYGQDRFKTDFLEVGAEVIKESEGQLGLYGEGTTLAEVTESVDEVDLDDVLAGWSGPESPSNPKDVEKAWRRHVRTYLRQELLAKHPVEGKNASSYH